jgi:hypothetical protein
MNFNATHVSYNTGFTSYYNEKEKEEGPTRGDKYSVRAFA